MSPWPMQSGTRLFAEKQREWRRAELRYNSRTGRWMVLHGHNAAENPASARSYTSEAAARAAYVKTDPVEPGGPKFSVGDFVHIPQTREDGIITEIVRTNCTVEVGDYIDVWHEDRLIARSLATPDPAPRKPPRPTTDEERAALTAGKAAAAAAIDRLDV